MSGRSYSLKGPIFGGLTVLAALAGGLGLWGATASIEGAVIAPAVIEVATDEVVVQHPEGGVVAAVPLREGDSVAAGDTLVRLDPTRLDAEIAEADSQYFELLARRARLEAERDGSDTLSFAAPLLARAKTDPAVAELATGQENLFDARARTRAEETREREIMRARLAEELRAHATERAGIIAERAIVREELGDQQSLLDQGLVQMTRVRGLQRTAAQLDARLDTLAVQASATRMQSQEVDALAARLEEERRAEVIAELRDTSADLRLLDARRAALAEDRRRLEIVAPIAGVVHDLRVTAARAVIGPRDPIMTLVPQDQSFRVMAQIAASEIDRVWPGQPVTLRLTALDQRRTPRIDGTVSWVSADALTEQQSGRSYYRAEIAFAEDTLPEGVSLVPGMPVEAFLKTGARTPLAYLLKPLTDYMTRAFREARLSKTPFRSALVATSVLSKT
ncbi:HlyD family type I secretion periplasmic adaptor subunit [Roseivivax sp. THAF30]|uniref:HlyD family type I secretion periplasmic adaptor subunit n=1 Tax=Roseivivax sp. THAF30 TaxID=2587852 RepID=UPI00126884D1|nr:HlyD family type I secretion periplasmic adaptor subunit [Roseivivax sp. THAF30]QFT61489.1 Type I secretion system membrane fusion protein PrsE [Roseivivax sp. THAF30]